MSDSTARADVLADKATAFTALHVPGDPILLPNAWDAASAHVIAAAGAKAIATSSAACAWSIGRADGNVMSRDEALGQVRRIVDAVDLPVTADVETGYGDDGDAGDDVGEDDALAETIRAVIGTGAVGVNLEDSGGDPLYPVNVAAHRISVARSVADAAGIPVHINARVDVFFASVGDPAGRLAATIERAAAYVDAGASSIFVPGVRDIGTIGALADAIAVPINILAGSATPDRAALAAAGVGRISVGSSLNLAMLAALRSTVTDLLGSGSFAALGGIPYPELNSYFAGR